MSHPPWVRGLKRLNKVKLRLLVWSHPTWVRGLKQDSEERVRDSLYVAPHVGAWIETSSVT